MQPSLPLLLQTAGIFFNLPQVYLAYDVSIQLVHTINLV